MTKTAIPLALFLLLGAQGASWAQGGVCPPSKDQLRNKRFADAERTLRKCLKADPGHVTLWLDLTRALAGQKKWSEARKWIDKAHRAVPGDLDILTYRIRIMAWSGKLQQAWSETGRIARAAQTDVDKAMLIADIAYWRKDCAEAVKRYNFVLGKWPDQLRARQNRARCHKQQGKQEKVKEDVNFVCFKFGPGSAECKRLRALEQQPKPPPPRPAAPAPGPAAPAPGPAAPAPAPAPPAPQPGAQAQPGAPAQPVLKCYQLGLYVWRRKYQTAENLGRRCVRDNPRNYRAWGSLLKVLQRQRKYDDALTLINEQLRKQPRSRYFGKWKVQILNARGDYQQAYDEAKQRKLDKKGENGRGTARMMSTLAFRRRRYQEAIQRYEAFLKKWPDENQSRYNLATAYRRVGRLADAEREYASLCTRKRVLPRSCHWLKRVRARMEREGKVALSASPGGAPSPEAQLRTRGQALLKRYQRDERRARARLRQNPRNVRAWVALLKALEAQGKVDEAGRQVKRARAHLPRSETIQVWQVRVLGLQGKHEQAWKEKESFNDRLSKDRFAAETVGDLAYWKGDHFEAAKRYTFYLILWPNNLDVVLKRGRAFKKAGDDQRAAEDLARACPKKKGPRASNCPDMALVQLASAVDQAKTLAVKRRYEEALQLVDGLIKRYPRNREYRILRVRILAWSGDHDQAWKETAQFKDLMRKDWEVARLIADIAYWRKDYKEAVDRYTFSLILHPNDRQAHLNRGLSYLALKQLGPAEQDLKKACELYGRFSSACRQYRNLRIKRHGAEAVAAEDAKKKKPGQAQEDEEDIYDDEEDQEVEVADEDPCAAAERHIRNQRHARAEEALRGCLETEKDNHLVMFELTKALAAQKEYDEALIWIDRAIAKVPDQQGYQLYRIRILAWKGDLEPAWKAVKAYRKHSPKDQQALRLAGDIAAWRKDCDRAVILFTLYLEQWPDHPQIRLNRARCYMEMGKGKLARQEMRAACKAGLEAACRDIDAIRAGKQRYTVQVGLGYNMVEDNPFVPINDGWQLHGLFSARVWRSLTLGTSIYLEGRQIRNSLPENPNTFYLDHDFFVTLFGSYAWQNGWGLSGAVGVGIVPDYLSQFQARLEPSYTFPFNLKLALMVWRLHFKDSGSTVLSPMLGYGIKWFALYLRYYLGIKDDGSVGNSGLLKLGFTPHWRLGLTVGAGVGDTPEYLDPTAAAFNAYFFYSLLAGVRFNISLRHALLFDYTYRDEFAHRQPGSGLFTSTGDLHFRQHLFLLFYRVRF